MLNKVELARNDLWIFYKTELTASANRWAEEKWRIKDIVAVMVEERLPDDETNDLFGFEERSPERSYLLLDLKRDQQPIYETNSYESLLYHIDFIGIARSFN